MHKLYPTMVFAVTVLLLLSACRPQRDQPTSPNESTSDATVTASSAADGQTLTAIPAPPAESPLPDTPQAVPVEGSVVPASIEDSELGLLGLEDAFPDAGEVLPTATPLADSELVPVRELGLGEPGTYANVTFGYELRYPSAWFTGFGVRPVLASFSNLDPGTTNREGMRANGCLIEISSSTNTYNFNLAGLMAQSPQTYEGAEETVLDDVAAVLMVRGETGQSFNTEILQVIANDRFFVLTFEYAAGQEETCRPAWDEMRANWRWFEPDLIAYRNQAYGYTISHPRRWFLYNSTDQGIFISSIDPTTVTSVQELAREGMIVHTHVFENPNLLPLREFLTQNINNLGLTNNVDLSSIIGVRALKDGPLDTEMMTGYFQGPLGRIYVIDILYPSNRIQAFRPIANAIIYSFDF